MKKHVICIDTEKCTGCGLCAKDCPMENISLVEKTAAATAKRCIFCGHCTAICPKSAISMTGFAESPEEIAHPHTLQPQILLEALRCRRSIRQFQKKPVPQDIIAQIIEAGRITPTAKNAQDVSYVVLQDGKEKYEQHACSFLRRLQPIADVFSPSTRGIVIDDFFFFKQAPLVLLVLSKTPVNGALAAANMALMAEAHGLGVLYSGYFAFAAKHSRTLRKALCLSRGTEVVATLVLGYPAVIYQRTVQREPAVVRYL